MAGALKAGIQGATRYVAISVLAGFTTLVGSCGSASQDPQLANGWVTNCSGSEFRKFSQVNGAGPGTTRPVFKIDDQLVLAVPKSAWPSSGRIEHELAACHSISDLPQVHYLYFVVQGNWSGSLDPKALPSDIRAKKIIPDSVTVRVEHDASAASVSDEAARVEQVASEFQNKLLDKREIGGLNCGRIAIPPHPTKQTGFICRASRTSSGLDNLRLRTGGDERKTPLVFVDAINSSRRYGGILVYWQVWTLDLAHAREIDQAIWERLSEWNLIEEKVASPSSH
jgi:hypothetical protein